MKPLKITAWPLAVGLAACLATTAHAAPLVFDNISALDAAKQISDKYGVNIVFKGDFGPPQKVSFSLSDADADGARLEAVNALANAVGADFSKTYVVSKATGDDTPAPRVDTNASVEFPSATLSAPDAISMVASVDNATVQVSPDVTGDVTLDGTKLDDAAAAAEVAKQTGTRWKVFYAMTPRLGGHQTGGKVIGTTAGGSPITELPYVYYKHFPTPEELAAQQQAADRQAERQQQQLGAQQAAAQRQALAMQQANGYNYYDPNGGYADGYSGMNNGGPYNYSPAGNGYYDAGGNFNPPGFLGYGANGNVNTGSGLIIGGGGGYNGPIVFQSPGY